MTDDVAHRLLDLCREHGLSIGVAESLTGGLLAATLVDVPGASRVFRGGVIAYDTRLKHSLLGVDATLLATEGPVHSDVAVQMAQGARIACSMNGEPASIGLSTTGVAGPDPDPHSGQPAGTVWIGWSFEGSAGSKQLALHGGRADVRLQTVDALLREILVKLSQLDSDSGTSRE